MCVSNVARRSKCAGNARVLNIMNTTHTRAVLDVKKDKIGRRLASVTSVTGNSQEVGINQKMRSKVVLTRCANRVRKPGSMGQTRPPGSFNRRLPINGAT
jgi:hypothetical protein